MSALHTALAADRLTVDSPAWVLLRSRNAATAVALLGAHLTGEDRRLPAPELFERVDEDLVVLREHGFDLPRTARAYCDEWRQDGILVRRPAGDSREETYELSDGALLAIQFVTDLLQPRTSVTQSRLATILERLHDLAVATDPRTESRLAALRAERDRIDAEIARVAAGEHEVLAVERAVEQARDILDLAGQLPADFARVRAELERLNRSLRARLVEDTDSRGTVLDDIFRGVDHLAESDAGRSFDGFYRLILDTEQVTAFEDDVDGVLDRDFAAHLGPAEARALRRLLPALQDASGEIHDVMTAFSRSLRRFVQSEELAEHREVQNLVQRAQREALTLAGHVQPFARTDLELSLTSVTVDSVGALALHNPADHRTAADVETRTPDDDVDWAALVAAARASEIDLAELRSHVNQALARRGRLTVGELLDEHPASQGLASVVGLLVLAEEHAVALDGVEPVTWTAASGAQRSGTVPRRLFTREVP